MSFGHSELSRSLINAGFGRMSALGANRTRRDSGNDVNRTATGCCRRRGRWRSCAGWRGRDLAPPGTPLVMSLGLARTKKNRRRPARNRRPADGSGGGLLQIGCGRQIELAGYDERRAAPIGAEPSRINRGEVTREPCRVVTRERVAVALVQVAVVVAEVEREHTPGDGETDAPGGIALVRNAVGKRRGTARNGAGLGAVEVIARAQEPMAHLA